MASETEGKALSFSVYSVRRPSSRNENFTTKRRKNISFKGKAEWRLKSRGNKTEFLALERDKFVFNQEHALWSTEKWRGYRDKRTLLMCSRRFTMLFSNCCFLACRRQKITYINAKKQYTKFCQKTWLCYNPIDYIMARSEIARIHQNRPFLILVIFMYKTR